VPYDDIDYGLILSVYLAETQTREIQLSDEHIDFVWCGKDVVIERLSEKYPISFLEKLIKETV